MAGESELDDLQGPFQPSYMELYCDSLCGVFFLVVLCFFLEQEASRLEEKRQ